MKYWKSIIKSFSRIFGKKNQKDRVSRTLDFKVLCPQIQRCNKFAILSYRFLLLQYSVTSIVSNEYSIRFRSNNSNVKRKSEIIESSFCVVMLIINFFLGVLLKQDSIVHYLQLHYNQLKCSSEKK